MYFVSVQAYGIHRAFARKDLKDEFPIIKDMYVHSLPQTPTECESVSPPTPKNLNASTHKFFSPIRVLLIS